MSRNIKENKGKILVLFNMVYFVGNSDFFVKKVFIDGCPEFCFSLGVAGFGGFFFSPNSLQTANVASVFKMMIYAGKLLALDCRHTVKVF